jgi:hypothetical protein
MRIYRIGKRTKPATSFSNGDYLPIDLMENGQRIATVGQYNLRSKKLSIKHGIKLADLSELIIRIEKLDPPS